MGIFDGLLKEKSEDFEPVDFPPSSETTTKALCDVYGVWYKTKVIFSGGWVSDVVVAGGSVRDLFFDRTPRDIDIYLTPSRLWWGDRHDDEDKVMEILLSMIRKLDNTFDLKCRYTASESHIKNFLNCEKPCSVLKLGEAKYNGKRRYLQFMIPKAVTPQGVVDNFDLDICQFAYDGSKFYTGTDMDIQSVKRALLGKGPVKLINPITTKTRLDKFESRFDCDVDQARKQMAKFLRKETDWDRDIDEGFAGVDNPLHDFHGVGKS